MILSLATTLVTTMETKCVWMVGWEQIVNKPFVNKDVIYCTEAATNQASASVTMGGKDSTAQNASPTLAVFTAVVMLHGNAIVKPIGAVYSVTKT